MNYDIKFTKGRFYIEDFNGKMIAEVTYVEQYGDTLHLDHTFVDESLRGQGVAKMLVDKVVELARKENKDIFPKCPYARSLFERKDEYDDVFKR